MSQMLDLLKVQPVLDELTAMIVKSFKKEDLLNPEIDFHRKDSGRRALKVWNNKDQTYWAVLKTPTCEISMRVHESKILNQ